MHQDAAFSAIRRALMRLLSDFAEPVLRFVRRKRIDPLVGPRSTP